MASRASSDRPLRADARRNRALVLRTAEQALSEEGMAVSFDEIARRAGVGVGTVYRHFPQRESLFEAVILGRIDQFVAQARELADADDPGAAFVAYFSSVIEQLSLNQALCDALEASTGLGFKADSTSEHDFRDALRVLLHRAQRNSSVRSDLDIADVQDLLIGCASAARHARRRGGLDHLVGIFLDALRGTRSTIS